MAATLSATLFSSLFDCLESTAKTTSSGTKAIAAGSAMLPVVTAQTVGFDRRFGGRISLREDMPGKLKRYAYPTIGKLPIPEIKPSQIYELLRPIWVEKRES